MIRNLLKWQGLRSLLVWQVTLSLTLSACVSLEPYYSNEAQNWQKEKPAPESEVLYSVFLIGDVGAPDLENGEPSMMLMRRQMEVAGAKSATIFLGDNVYMNGLPLPDKYDREVSEKRLNAQLDILRGYEGEKYMIPGNHDWNHSGRGGLEAVTREQRYVNEYLTDENIVVGGDFYVPGDGCPGPYEVMLSDNLVLIALDTEWWLHPFDRPYGDNSSCGASTEEELLVQLEDVIEKHRGRDILVVGHHPLITRGEHGGFFTIKDHLFPLTMLRKWMYLPLPVIGSIYPFARKYGGILQDIPHPRYQAYIEGVMEIFTKYGNITYAAGHEHGLEYFNYNGLPHIVSGSGCKVDYLKPGGAATYLQTVKGYVRVNYHENGEVWSEFWVPTDKTGTTGEIMFRTRLYAKEPPKENPPITDNTNYADSTITLAANTSYKAPKLRKKLLGEHYRDEWATPVEVPLLDLKNELGGLTPYQKGGGKQTAALKVRNPDAKEYTLRSINKSSSKVLPEFLREVAVSALLQDQTSSQHPYGSLIVPPLADAAGVFHTNPKLVYIPNTPYLRQYQDEFGNMLAILEEDPDENHEEIASLGNAENLVGTDKLLEELEQDNDNEVDQPEYVRARLFDMFIGDWDRHEGQWRWVEEKKEGKGKLYIPVPEDRDQAFFKAEGILPWLATRKWGIRNIRSFGHEYRDIVGLNLNGLTLDRTFTSKITRQEWLRIAEDIKQSMTDEVIEKAVLQWPEPIRQLSADEIVSKLKSRRDKLPQAAAKYYDFLVQYVDITGSDKHERFVINRINNEEMQVLGYKISKEGEILEPLYDRTFYTDETKEIRLYGRDGRDQFIVSGSVDKSILVRIIAGGDEDLVVDSSYVSGLKEYTIVYDTAEGNVFNFGSETDDKTEPYEEVNLYDRDNYKPAYVAPRFSAAYNVDDGPLLGAGLLLRTHGFRKYPHAAEHLLEGNYAFLTNSYDVRYRADLRDVVGNWNLAFNAHLQGPQFQRNFYGLGNHTEQAPDLNDEYYRVRYERQSLSAAFFRHPVAFVRIGFGPTYDRFRVTMPEGETFLLNQARQGRLRDGTYKPETGKFDSQHYVGVRAFTELKVLGGGSTEANPRIGMRWYNTISYNKQVGGEQLSYTNFSSEFRFYLSPYFPFQLTWAGRVGAAHNFGDYRFYQANTLGGTENLRGYRRTRFAGRSSVYANGEARLQLLDYNLFLVPGKFGILGLLDAGRVYMDDEPKEAFFRSLHLGYGGGLWMDVLSRSVLSLSYTAGEEEELLMLNFGFFF
ncbi:BamA/TamA family outer membrane protein [Pontibacter toksunensis]|uniref:BamA/TamA family outer membrane protein n=1 Tax=Pontibacter toksunensis TaxID=1332631 RepID=A0ABW6BU88_9BACT